jgi:pimeloyl-ACP methyl ester carboxylesterase
MILNMKAPFKVLALFLSVLFLATWSRGQAPEDAQKVKPLDLEYRKLDDFFSWIRRQKVEQYAINPAKGIDEERFVSIGGIEQWVTVRGQDRNNPVLLFLHGGPGEATSLWTFVAFAPWEEHFTVVQWDQRGAGKTYGKNDPEKVAPTMKLDRMVQDGIELSEYLRKYLGKDKIIVVGHSFGSVLGTLMARARPDLFYAYVGTGQVVDSTRNYQVAYEALLKKARAVGNQKALKELGHVGPPPYSSGEGYGVQRRWSNAFEGADQFLLGNLGLVLVYPGSSAKDFNDFLDGQRFSGEYLVGHISVQPKDLGLDFAVPMFVIQGAEDFTTPTELARQYLASLKAPRKTFVTIPGGGHFAVFIKSDQFLAELVKRVLPLAVEHKN